MVYPEDFEKKTGFDRIRSMTAGRCLTEAGAELVNSMKFLTDYETLQRELSKTWEFQQILLWDDPFPADNFTSISGILEKLKTEGTFPEINELITIRKFLECLKAVLNYFKNRESSKYPVLKEFASEVKFFQYVADAVDRIIDRQGNIKDSASAELRTIRQNLSNKRAIAAKKLNDILKQAQVDGIVEADANISIRNGRGVIPVNAAFKRKINGLVHDQSASGKTVYIEPAVTVEINNEIIELEYEEKREIIRILITFANNIRTYINDLLTSDAFIAEIDFIRAKALIGNHFGSLKPEMASVPRLNWKNAVHPLLYETFRKFQGRQVVPLDISLNEKNRFLLISGPNAGGKSVCLKTVGLLQYMVQCGMTIPVHESSQVGLFTNIFIDIGDEQSIENDLSTYSSHLINMKFFLKNASDDTLILIDELGTGTEPVLGGAIAEAILAQLIRKGAYGVVTTHYSNLKHFASKTVGIVNAAMMFDNHLIQPLFRLDIGKPGSSFAFEIARKIGLPGDILNEAEEKAGKENVKFDRHLKDIARDKRYWEKKRQNIRLYEKKLEELIREYENELAGARNMSKEIISKAREEAQNLLAQSNRIIENTIRQIKESQAEKESTRKARKELEQFRNDITTGVESVIENKIAGIEDNIKKIRKTIKAEEEVDNSKEKMILREGDAVRMVGSTVTGEIVEIKDEMITVETGSFKFQISAEKLEKISRSELRESIRTGKAQMYTDPLITQRKLNFKPEIDIRGVRGEEAISIVRNLIDDAVMVQHRNLRIIHGKGNGILRQLIRQYLASTGIVKSISDEHVERGGAGITLVELDL